MRYDTELGDVKNRLGSAKNIAVLLSRKTTEDQVAAALSLFLSLQKNDTNVVIVSEDTLKVSHAHLFGVGEVKSRLPEVYSGNYIITLEGVVEESEGVIPSLKELNWNADGKNLNLVFHTNPGYSFEPKKVTPKQETADFDLIFVVGATQLPDLGGVYLQNKDRFIPGTIVNIDNNSGNTLYGEYNVVDTNAVSISEMMMQVIQTLGLSIDGDIASNVIAGLYSATNNLTQNVKSETFISIGEAMQYGGLLPKGVAQAPIQQTPVQVEEVKKEEQVKVEEPKVEETVTTEEQQDQITETSTDQPQQPVMSGNFDFSVLFGKSDGTENPISQIEDTQISTSQEEAPHGEAVSSGSKEGDNPAPDWLTPKVYKGRGLG